MLNSLSVSRLNRSNYTLPPPSPPISRFCSVTFVALAHFCPNFHHTLIISHCTFFRKIGAEGSVLQELCHFVILTKMFSMIFIVYTFSSSWSFQCILLILCRYVRDILKMCMKMFNAEKIILTNLQHFQCSQFSTTVHIE